MSTTTKNILRIFGAFVLSFIASTFWVSFANPLYGIAGALIVSIVFAIVLMRAMQRAEDLNEWIGLELNKIRRIYHLGKNLGTDPRLRQWFTDLHGHLYGYLTAFDKKDFSQYQETNGDFRKLSYHLYEVPALETEKERVLYRDLLETAGAVAGARQRIQELWNGGLPPSVWNMLLALAVLAGLGVLTTIAPGNGFQAGVLLAILTAEVSLVRDGDQLKTVQGKATAKRYVENIARLELRRHGE